MRGRMRNQEDSKENMGLATNPHLKIM